jgi:hypothetical protein
MDGLKQPIPIRGNFGAKTIIMLHPENVYSDGENQHAQHGQLALYPACPLSKLFCELCGTKTFTPHMVDKVAALGYELNRVYNPENKTKYKV